MAVFSVKIHGIFLKSIENSRTQLCLSKNKPRTPFPKSGVRHEASNPQKSVILNFQIAVFLLKFTELS